MRAIDLAPTIAFLMGIPGPQNARGKILYNLTAGQGKYKEITFLDISDFHGQLVPLSEAADNVDSNPTLNPAVRDRRVGLPEAVVRSLSRRGAGGPLHGRRGRLGRSDATDLRVLRRHTDDRSS